jgi:hypothetical protein
MVEGKEETEQTVRSGRFRAPPQSLSTTDVDAPTFTQRTVGPTLLARNDALFHQRNALTTNTSTPLDAAWRFIPFTTQFHRQ